MNRLNAMENSGNESIRDERRADQMLLNRQLDGGKSAVFMSKD